MNKQLRATAAKWVGILSCAAILILWLGVIVTKQPQYTAQAIPEGAWHIGGWIIDTVDLKMIALAILGVLAVLSRKPLLILLVFLLLFIPVGLYSLGLPGWGKLVGVANLLFASSSLLMPSHRQQIRKT